MLERLLRHDQDGNPIGQGRNIFITSKGYYGLGVFGPNEPGCESAVQIDDNIAVLPSLEQPLVLRPDGNSKYRIVGPSFIPEIEKDELLQEGNRGPMEQICII
ncbi:hypothetical protein BKA64DRAFT_672505 [Cadophora sp. MPI-SDFR-AT-0126]|nr:hypothetical protein BKA64DRAFT_672505 [Leotiomycetes sp. MPI-SDFR-AT-0126]